MNLKLQISGFDLQSTMNKNYKCQNLKENWQDISQHISNRSVFSSRCTFSVDANLVLKENQLSNLISGLLFVLHAFHEHDINVKQRGIQIKHSFQGLTPKLYVTFDYELPWLCLLFHIFFVSRWITFRFWRFLDIRLEKKYWTHCCNKSSEPHSSINV